MAIGRINATLTGVQPGGLAKIIPTSIAVGSGSGSVDGNGNVTFSGASSVSINGCFTTNHTKYLIEPSIQISAAGGGINMRLRAAGSDNTSAIYRRQYISGNNTSVTGARITGSTSWINALYNADSNEYTSSLLFVNNPAQTTYTSALINYLLGAYADVETSFQGYGINSTTSFDGFSLIPASGTITGTVSIYGYAK